MKAYLTSIGERTTGLVYWQLERLGFEVVIMDLKESWWEKYKKFITWAEAENEPCIRIDADVIPNNVLARYCDALWVPHLKIMVQFQTYDLYQNSLGITSPVLYFPEALRIIKRDLEQVDPRRPEATSWRLPDIKKRTHTSELVVGLHGFYQDQPAIDRAKKNKRERKQFEHYDFALAEKIIELL